MRGIVIGAGRGQRLMPTTANAPKCYTEVAGRSILEWILEAFRQGGVNDVCFIGGYYIDAIRRDYPDFTFRHNTNWANNNILVSLMHAEDLMDEPFVVSYADILFTGELVSKVATSTADITLGVDTDFLQRYEHRTEHPLVDAEKLTAAEGVVTRVDRDIDPPEAYGEYTGVAKFSADGAAQLREHYHRCRKQYAGKPFHQAALFEKAYLIHLLQDMIEHGVAMTHVDTKGLYWEIDTQQDYEHAKAAWRKGQ